MLNLALVSSDTNIGGAGKCIKILFDNIDKKTFSVKIILPPASLLSQLFPEESVIFCEGIADKSLSMQGIINLREIFQQLHPHIVHCHGCMSARIAAKIYGKSKIIYTRHSVFEPSRLISTFPGKWINGVVNHYFSHGIIAVAQAAKENLLKTGVSPEKIRVILNGIPPVVEKHDKKAIFKRMGIPPQKIISLVARVTEVKGHEYFIKAAYILLKRGFQFKFVIAGTGDILEQLKYQVKALGLTDHVMFTGFLKDVSDLLNITDIIVNCSYGTEATSLSLLEAMSLGIPAVVTDFGGNTGVILHGINGLVIPTKDERSLALSIERLLTDKQLYNRLSQGALKIFNERFTEDVYTRQTENYYKELQNEKTI